MTTVESNFRKYNFHKNLFLLHIGDYEKKKSIFFNYNRCILSFIIIKTNNIRLPKKSFGKFLISIYQGNLLLENKIDPHTLGLSDNLLESTAILK